MKVWRVYLFIFLLETLAVSCVTPYQPLGWRGGYSEIQLDSNLFKVSYRGNGYTSSENVLNGWLHRCAEIAKKKGYPFFEIVSGDTHTDVTENQNPVYCSGHSFGGNTNVTCNGGGVTQIKRHEANGEIKLLRKKPTMQNPNIFDAHIVLRNFATGR